MRLHAQIEFKTSNTSSYALRHEGENKNFLCGKSQKPSVQKSIDLLGKR